MTPSFLSAGDLRPFIAKFGFPAFFLLSAFLICQMSFRTPGIVLGIIWGLPGVIYFSITGLVKIEPECLQYRRFTRWRRIEYQEIVKCGPSIFPALCYLKLRHFEPPFGKLYFVLNNPVERIWEQPNLDKQTIEYIRARTGMPTTLLLDKPIPEAEKREDTLKRRLSVCAFSALSSTGVILFLRTSLGWPGPNFPPKGDPSQGWLWNINVGLWGLCAHILDWPYNLIAVVGLTAGILLFRFNRWATSLALGLGAIVGGVLARLMS